MSFKIFGIGPRPPQTMREQQEFSFDNCILEMKEIENKDCSSESSDLPSTNPFRPRNDMSDVNTRQSSSFSIATTVDQMFSPDSSGVYNALSCDAEAEIDQVQNIKDTFKSIFPTIMKEEFLPLQAEDETFANNQPTPVQVDRKSRRNLIVSITLFVVVLFGIFGIIFVSQPSKGDKRSALPNSVHNDTLVKTFSDESRLEYLIENQTDSNANNGDQFGGSRFESNNSEGLGIFNFLEKDVNTHIELLKKELLDIPQSHHPDGNLRKSGGSKELTEHALQTTSNKITKKNIPLSYPRRKILTRE